MKLKRSMILILLVLISSFSFGATKTSTKTPVKTTSKVSAKTSASSTEQWVINTSFDELGIGGEYITKKSDIMYGGGVYFSYDDHDNYYYWDSVYYDAEELSFGVYGLIGKPFKGTNFSGQFKLGIVSRNYNYYGKKENDLDSVWGLGVGYKINKDYDFYTEVNSDRGLVLGVGMKI